MSTSHIPLDRVSGPIWLLASALAKTWRFRYSGSCLNNPLASTVQPRIFCFWHTNILPVFYLGSRCELTALISGSRDGQRLSAVLQRWGYDLVRGSSSKEGFAALRECIRRVSSGRNVILTPDGPRGPALTMKAGAAQISLLSGVPLIPISCTSSSSWRLNSWDRFTIPKPFATVHIRTADPIDPMQFKGRPDAVELLIAAAEKGLNKI